MFMQMFVSCLFVCNVLFVFVLVMLLMVIGLCVLYGWQVMMWCLGVLVVVMVEFVVGELVKQFVFGVYDFDDVFVVVLGIVFDYVFVLWNVFDIDVEIGNVYWVV